MRVIGLSMIGTAVAMVVLARPRDGKVVACLRSDNRQWAFGTAIVVLLALGFALSLD
jgi:hypothetical protein